MTCLKRERDHLERWFMHPCLESWFSHTNPYAGDSGHTPAWDPGDVNFEGKRGGVVVMLFCSLCWGVSFATLCVLWWFILFFGEDGEGEIGHGLVSQPVCPLVK